MFQNIIDVADLIYIQIRKARSATFSSEFAIHFGIPFNDCYLFPRDILLIGSEPKHLKPCTTLTKPGDVNWW